MSRRTVQAIRALRDRLAELTAAANAFDVLARASDGRLPVADVQAATATVAAAAEQMRLALAQLYRAGQSSKDANHGVRNGKAQKAQPPSRVAPRWPLLLPGGLDGDE